MMTQTMQCLVALLALCSDLHLMPPSATSNSSSPCIKDPPPAVLLLQLQQVWPVIDPCSLTLIYISCVCILGLLDECDMFFCFVYWAYCAEVVLPPWYMTTGCGELLRGGRR
jgi:hypothetical protein